MEYSNTYSDRIEPGKLAAVLTMNGVRFVRVSSVDGRGCVTTIDESLGSDGNGSKDQWNIRNGRRWGRSNGYHRFSETRLVSSNEGSKELQRRQRQRNLEGVIARFNNMKEALPNVASYDPKTVADRLEALAQAAALLADEALSAARSLRNS